MLDFLPAPELPRHLWFQSLCRVHQDQQIPVFLELTAGVRNYDVTPGVNLVGWLEGRWADGGEVCKIGICVFEHISNFVPAGPEPDSSLGPGSAHMPR